MAFSPETLPRMQTDAPDRPARDRTLRSARLGLIWVVLVIPGIALTACLHRALDSALDGAGLIAVLALSGMALFSAVVIAVEASRKSGAEGGSPRRLLVAGAALPLTLALLGAVAGFSTSPMAVLSEPLLLLAGQALIANLVCWLLARALVADLGRAASDRRDAVRAAFRLVESSRRRRRYSPPVRPALAGLLLLAFFALAFGLGAWRVGSTVLLVVFALLVLLLLSLDRFRELSAGADREHIATTEGSTGSATWIWRVGAALLLVSLAAAASPLSKLVELGQFLRDRPAPPSAFQAPSAGLAALAPAGVAGDVMSLLLLLLLILAASLALWWLRRRVSRTRLWRAVEAWVVSKLLRLYRRVLGLLARLFPWRSRSCSVEEEASVAAQPRTLRDVFASPEAMALLTPAQVIIATFHLMIELSWRHGWLRTTTRPPFEAMAAMRDRGRIDEAPLMELTWAYAEASYSGRPIAQERLTEVRRAWERVKPHMIGDEDLE